MSIVFSSSDLINTAIGIERRGITFYDVMAKSTDNEAARAVFDALVVMEREHLRIFQEMLDEADTQPSADSSEHEYSGYLRSYLSSLHAQNAIEDGDSLMRGQ